MKRSLSDKRKISTIAMLGEKVVEEYIEDIIDKKYKNEGYELIFYNQWNFNIISHIGYSEIKKLQQLSSIELENEFLRRNWTYSRGRKVYVTHGKWNSNIKYSDKNFIINNWKKDMLNDYTDQNRKNIITHFIRKNIYPNENLIKKMIEFFLIFENYPDGLILKLKNTKKYKYKEELKEELKGFMNIDSLNIDIIPIYDGEILFIEVKTRGSLITEKQKISYLNYIERGFKLIYYYVNVISFDNNEYELYESIINNETELYKENARYKKIWSDARAIGGKKEDKPARAQSQTFTYTSFNGTLNHERRRPEAEPGGCVEEG